MKELWGHNFYLLLFKIIPGRSTVTGTGRGYGLKMVKNELN